MKIENRRIRRRRRLRVGHEVLQCYKIWEKTKTLHPVRYDEVWECVVFSVQMKKVF
jgi:hypothetical protein